MVGMFHSDERLIEHVTSVYEKVIRASEELVEAAFVALGDRLVHHVTFPARYVGVIHPKRRPEAGGAFGLPVLYGYFKPLPRSESSRIEPQLSVQRPKLGVGREVVEELRRQRPEAARWITAWIGSEILSLSGRAPSTNLAYKWRWQDLVYTRIVTGHPAGQRPGVLTKRHRRRRRDSAGVAKRTAPALAPAQVLFVEATAEPMQTRGVSLRDLAATCRAVTCTFISLLRRERKPFDHFRLPDGRAVIAGSQVAHSWPARPARRRFAMPCNLSGGSPACGDWPREWSFGRSAGARPGSAVTVGVALVWAVTSDRCGWFWGWRRADSPVLRRLPV
jgi:hypothetical protein